MQAVMQNSTFFHTPLTFLSKYRITEYCDPGQLMRAGSQDTDLSCHVPISTCCCTTWIHQRYRRI